MRFYSILIVQGMLGVTIIITTTVAYYLKHKGAAEHFICDKARIANKMASKTIHFIPILATSARILNSKYRLISFNMN